MIDILYEDAHLIAADKPPGMHTAPLRRGESGTLLDRLIARYPGLEKVPGYKGIEPGLLHRLDRETSGVVIVARSEEAFKKLSTRFDRGEALKEYVAVCAGTAGAEGSHFLLKSRFAPFGPGGKRVRVVTDGAGRALAKRATADEYSTEAVVERRREGLLYVRVRIRKGFRHQIRAHLAFLGMPIVGDALYGVPVTAGAEKRMYLHARLVEVRHPFTDEPLRIVSTLPPSFEDVFKEGG
jgi:23S rRNA pseudouridine1911/1915/1917 synthase